ncbi:hypothetical protein E2L06_10260 [Haloterrigena sp. H1]|uniref:hypothetical protein n=1 Tax=Haloterrigena sp. H1 TaxID=2552943 RepID=UPI00110EFCBB|nr:hypothetical protein [Haloterrigena sp. H1]TMT86965.1 hypothetical protein E2L06_10260 [Haloterrigena sp. H1]
MIEGVGTVWRGIVLRTLRWRGAAEWVGLSCTALERDWRLERECVVPASSVDFEGGDGVVELKDAGCVIELERVA